MKKIYFICAPLLALSNPAVAEVKTQSDAGFAVVHVGEVLAKPDDVWKRLLTPKDWWNPEHSWSGSSAGFYIDPQASGCFCELFQEKDGDGKLVTKGSVEHMRVLFSQPGKVLRMQGALGPLQSEAVTGTLTVAMEPLKNGAGSKISFSYVVGGYMRYKTAEIAPAVDAVIGEQFARMIKPLGKVVGEPAVESKPDPKPAAETDAKTAPKKDNKAKQLEEVVTAIKPEPKIGKPEKVEPVTGDES